MHSGLGPRGASSRAHPASPSLALRHVGGHDPLRTPSLEAEPAALHAGRGDGCRGPAARGPGAEPAQPLPCVLEVRTSDLVSPGELPGPRVPEGALLRLQEVRVDVGDRQGRAAGACLSRGGSHPPSLLPGSLRLSELGLRSFGTWRAARVGAPRAPEPLGSFPDRVACTGAGAGGAHEVASG